MVRTGTQLQEGEKAVIDGSRDRRDRRRGAGATFAEPSKNVGHTARRSPVVGHVSLRTLTRCRVCARDGG
jgi:hypothetical protein